MVVATFKLHCKPENRLEVKQSLHGIAAKVKKLDGCNNTEVYQGMGDNNIFFMVEKWHKQRHLDDHMKTSLFSALLGIRSLLTKEPKIMFLNEG